MQKDGKEAFSIQTRCIQIFRRTIILLLEKTFQSLYYTNTINWLYNFHFWHNKNTKSDSTMEGNK